VTSFGFSTVELRPEEGQTGLSGVRIIAPLKGSASGAPRIFPTLDFAKNRGVIAQEILKNPLIQILRTTLMFSLILPIGLENEVDRGGSYSDFSCRPLAVFVEGGTHKRPLGDQDGVAESPPL
jgi:hypothetical protein